MEIYVTISLISIFFSFFPGFSHDTVTYIDFTHVAVSNITTDDVTN